MMETMLAAAAAGVINGHQSILTRTILWVAVDGQDGSVHQVQTGGGKYLHRSRLRVDGRQQCPLDGEDDHQDGEQ